MRKKYTIFIILLGIAFIMGFTSFAVWQSVKSTPSFGLNGYILQSKQEQLQMLSFKQGENYSATLAGTISFGSVEEGRVSVPRERFLHLADESTMALSDGMLLDLNDLSTNFINNYYIPAGMLVSGEDGGYTAQTTAGDLSFGEHVWKLADNMYLIRSPELTVHMTDTDVHEAGSFVQIYITEDSVVHIQSLEGLWMTISPDCFIETQDGVRIYPVSMLVENDNYKLSLAKLAVTTEDAIVLSPLETRRQVVPELNIEAIDGKDGDDGDEGDDGKEGEEGDEGEGGSDGTKGEGGSDGTKGGIGGDGNKGTDGGIGGVGNEGEDGQRGNKGGDGENAGQESSAKSNLPVMTLTDWQVMENQVKGTIAIANNDFLLEIGSNWQDYAGKIALIEKDTGKIVSCYSTGNNLLYQEGEDKYAGGDPEMTKIDFYTDEFAELYFVSPANALKPDTDYILSVTGYYMTDTPAMIYSREFIRRSFSTGTTGASMSLVTVSQDSLTAAVNLSDDHNLDRSESSWIYLLTMEENALFTVESHSEIPAERKFSFTPGELQVDNEFDFEELDPNTTYILRTVLNIKVGDSPMKYLSKQELEVKTLKRLPKWPEKPKAIYNLSNGVFEARRPQVEDPDNGAVSYTYTAYLGDEVMSTRTVTPNTGEPIGFYLEAGKNYTFGVTMEFFDNEKTITYDMGRSDPVTAAESSGGIMPSLVLSLENVVEDGAMIPSVEYNIANGFLYINLYPGTSLVTNDPNQPVTLMISNGSGFSKELELAAEKTPTNLYSKDNTLMGSLSITSDEAITTRKVISLNLDQLQKNSTYSISVYGYVSLSSDEAPIQRYLGMVTFKTKDTVRLMTKWRNVTSSDDGDDSGSNGLMVSIAPYASSTGDETVSAAEQQRIDYALAELRNGYVHLQLLESGTQIVGSKSLEAGSKDLLALLSEEGLYVDRKYFGASAVSEAQYTVRVIQVSDSSYYNSKLLGYENVYEVENPEGEITAPTKFMDLPDDPRDLGIIYTPILNEEVGKYNGNKGPDPTLPDDAVVGYKLKARVTNSSGLADKITYYAYEIQEFRNQWGTNKNTKKDPVKKSMNQDTDAIHRIRAELDWVTTPSDKTAPSVVFLFGRHEDGVDGVKQGWKATDGSLVYWQDKDNDNYGMTRGYRYLFTYTVHYTSSSGTGSYFFPYDDPDVYSSAVTRSKGGIFYEYTDQGAAKIQWTNRSWDYFLQSGVVEVPLIEPTFYTYVNKTEGAENGNLVDLRVSWDSPETEYNGILKTHDDQFHYSFDASTTMSTAYLITPSNMRAAKNWYQVASDNSGNLITYTNNSASPYTTTLTLKADYKLYRHDYSTTTNGYNRMWDAMNGSLLPDESTHTVTTAVLDSYRSTNLASGIGWSLDTTTMQNNYVRIILDGDPIKVADLQYRTAGFKVSAEFYEPIAGGTGTSPDDSTEENPDENGGENGGGENGSEGENPDVGGEENISLLSEGDDAADGSTESTERTPLGEEVFYLPLSTSGTTKYISLDLSDSRFEQWKGKTVQIKSVEVLYDDGMQGWEYTQSYSAPADIENKGVFTVQRVDPSEGTMGDYIGVSGSTANMVDNPTNGLMWYNGSSGSGFDPDEAVQGALTLSYQSYVEGGSAIAPTVYLDKRGVYRINGFTANDELLAPKHIAKATLAEPSSDASKRFDLSGLTPTISNAPKFVSGVKRITLRSDFTVNFDNVDTTTKIYVGYVYSNTESTQLPATLNGVRAFTVDENGVPAYTYASGSDTAVAVTDSKRFMTFDVYQTGKTTYFYFYTEKVEENGTITRTPLLKKGTTDIACYKGGNSYETFQVKIGTRASSNTAYDKKQVRISYEVDDPTGYQAVYSLWGDQDGDGTFDSKLMDHTELTSSTGILAAPSLSLSNTLTLNLNPSQFRQKLKPGTRYELKIQIYSAEEDPAAPTGQEAGSNTVQFITPSSTVYDSVVTDTRNTSKRDSKGNPSLTFDVSVQDTASYSYMGGIYAVRFVDDQGNRVNTKFDKLFFSIQNAAHGYYVLSTENGAAEEQLNFGTEADGFPGRDYQIRVYAIYDHEHDGSVTLGNTTLTAVANEAGADFQTQFQTFLDACWEADGTKVDDMAEAEAAARIGEATMSTGPKAMVYQFDDNAKEVTISGSKVTYVFYGSTDLINSSGDQVFSKIDFQLELLNNPNHNIVINLTSYPNAGGVGFEAVQNGNNIEYKLELDLSNKLVGEQTLDLPGTYYLNMYLYEAANDTAAKHTSYYTQRKS